MDANEVPDEVFQQSALKWVAKMVDRLADAIERIESYAKLASTLEAHGGVLPEPIRGQGTDGDREYDTVETFNRHMRWDLENYRLDSKLAREALRIMMEAPVHPAEPYAQFTAALERFFEARKALDSWKPD